MSSRTSMSQSMKIDQPSKPHSQGVRKREKAKSVDCSGLRSRHICAPRLFSASGVIATGADERARMLCDSTCQATVSRGS